MNRLLILGSLVLSLLSTAIGAPTTFLVPPGTTISNTNNGVVTSPPQIDAFNFINYGIFNIITVGPGTPAPFETFDTMNYTNFGTMVGMNGWRFDFNSNVTGRHGTSANFINLNPGVVEADDPPALALHTVGVCAVSPVDPSYLLIYATNIMNGAGVPGSGASLIVGVNGRMELKGRSVDLAYSGLEVRSVSSEGFGSATTVDPTNFIPDIAIYDTSWAQGDYSDNFGLNSASLWNGTTANAPGVANPPGQTATPGFSLFNPYADSYINIGGFFNVTITNMDATTNVVMLFSNITKGAVFVGVPAGFDVTSGFSGSPQPRNSFETVTVGVSVGIPNVVTGQTETNGLFFRDTLASDTRVRGLSQNILYCSSPTTFRPANYYVDRLLFGFGIPNNQYPEPNFFIDSGNSDTNILFDSVTNAILTAGSFAGYSLSVDNLASRLPALPTATISNAPGRIIIAADRLNLTGTRMRGEGWIHIDTPHLISSSNAVIDCGNLSVDVGSKTGNLKVQSLVPDSVSRFRGTASLWSGTWSNSVTIILNNYSISNIVETNIVMGVTNVVTNMVTFPAPLTNVLGVAYHAFMVDARNLTTTQPVSVYDFSARSLNTEVDDNMTILQSLFINSRAFTLNGTITIPGAYPFDPVFPALSFVPALQNWTATNAPNIQVFTNNGTLFVGNEAHLGDDRLPYSAFINNGIVSATGIAIGSDYIENNGNLVAGAALFARGRSGVFANSFSTSGTASQFSFDDLKISNFQLGADGKLFLNITNSLSDAGPGSSNVFTLQDGLTLSIKPATGDLLGTTIQSIAASVGSIRIQHVWAGEDRGPTSGGYFNNEAIGVLALSSQSPLPLFVFSGAGPVNGLYVDLLDLSGLDANLLNEIQIDPNITIYYAAATLPPGFSIPNSDAGIPQTPEEFLNGKFNGRLQWVPTYAGANSSQTILINGQPTQVNKALFNSQIIDSDNDSIPNAFDVGPEVIPGGTISVDISGSGTVNPQNISGQQLLLGQTYTLVAHPSEGSEFLGWTGSIETNSPVLTFTMEDGLSFTAEFEFVPTAASYDGVFYQSTGAQLGQSGSIKITTTKKGKFSGVLQTGFGHYRFSGFFDDNGDAEIFGTPFQILVSNSGDQITGTIGDGETWTADLVLDRNSFNTKKNPAPFAGKYTIVFPGSGDVTNTQIPFGSGYGSINVSKSGQARFQGVLADGTKVTQTASVSDHGLWPLLVPLYRGSGQLLSLESFVSANPLSAPVNWIKEENDNARLYPDGFNFTTNSMGSPFNKTNAPITGFGVGTVTFSGGNLARDFSDAISVFGKKVQNQSQTKLKFKINPKTGLFNGSAENPGAKKPVKFKGAILQNQSSGSGFFLGTDQSGRISVNP